MTDADIIAAIKANHLRANVSWLEQAGGTLDWDRAVLDPGGTIFGPGPYAPPPDPKIIDARIPKAVPA